MECRHFTKADSPTFNSGSKRSVQPHKIWILSKYCLWICTNICPVTSLENSHNHYMLIKTDMLKRQRQQNWSMNKRSVDKNITFFPPCNVRFQLFDWWPRCLLTRVTAYWPRNLYGPLGILHAQVNATTVISRLHIGHSYVTHSFLLKGEEPPVGIPCDELLTIEHMLLFCSDVIDIREWYFTARSLRNEHLCKTVILLVHFWLHS